MCETRHCWNQVYLRTLSVLSTNIIDLPFFLSLSQHNTHWGEEEGKESFFDWMRSGSSNVWESCPCYGRQWELPWGETFSTILEAIAHSTHMHAICDREIESTHDRLALSIKFDWNFRIIVNRYHQWKSSIIHFFCSHLSTHHICSFQKWTFHRSLRRSRTSMWINSQSLPRISQRQVIRWVLLLDTVCSQEFRKLCIMQAATTKHRETREELKMQKNEQWTSELITCSVSLILPLFGFVLVSQGE